LEPQETGGEQDLRSYLRVLRRRKFTVVFITVVVVGLALAYSLVKTPIYTASTQVLVPEQSAAAALQPTGSQQAPAAASVQRELTDAQQFAKGDQTKAAAFALLHYHAPVSVSTAISDDVLTFTATNPSKTAAAIAANTYAQAYISANRANEVSQYTGQVLALQTSIAKLQVVAARLPAGSEQRRAATSSISSLTESLQQLQATSQLAAQTGPSIINAAVPPTSPTSPKPVRTGLLALFVGLILGLGLAFLRDRLDDKVKSPADVEANSRGLPIVGTIPLVDSWKKKLAPHIAFHENADSDVSEAYRTLRTAIQFLGIDEAQRVIGVTSSTPEEGKSTAAANLAVSFARAGQRVIVVSFDFRRPRLHLFFGLENLVGATSVLLGTATLDQALQDVAQEPNLRVLSSGPVPPNPAEILSLDKVRQLVGVLAGEVDILLVDCPPVLPVTDTLLISRLCDSMLVVAVAAGTRKGDLRRTNDLLSQVQAPVRGTILNRVPHRGAYASGYGYGYGYGYGSRESPKDSGQARAGSKSSPNGQVFTDNPVSNGHQTDKETAGSSSNGRSVDPGNIFPSQSPAQI
jgi:capsular exopolysaccharide synthesis family protein